MNFPRGMYGGRETGEDKVTYRIYGEGFLSLECLVIEGIIESMAKVSHL